MKEGAEEMEGKGKESFDSVGMGWRVRDIPHCKGKKRYGASIDQSTTYAYCLGSLRETLGEKAE